MSSNRPFRFRYSGWIVDAKQARSRYEKRLEDLPGLTKSYLSVLNNE